MTTDIKLPDSGATVRVKRISPLTLLAVERANPNPKPPLQEVDHGDGKLRHERNPLDPDYIDELAAHMDRKNMLIMRTLIKLGTEVEVDTARVQALRAQMAELNVTLDPDEYYVFVAHILCESNNDLNALRESIQSQALPTEQAVAEKQATFPGNVQGN